MATDLVNQIDKQSKNIGELLAFIQKELDADAERHAKLQPAAAEAGEVLQEAQTGATIDLSKRALSSLPVEAIELMKGRVERFVVVFHNARVWQLTKEQACRFSQLTNCHSEPNHTLRPFTLFEYTMELAHPISRCGTLHAVPCTPRKAGV